MATAAFQIEGAVHEGGRSPTIWDTFCHQTKGVMNSDNGDVACDHYHRWEADLDLIASLNVGAYRFSIAWSRIFPDNDTDINQAGVDFYNNLIDGCKKRNLKVFVTLYHWDLPQRLADQGGWTNRSTAEHFAHYAATITRLLGDRIDSICTFNEPWCSSILSHLYGVHAPGNKDLDTTLAVIHGQNRAHGLAVQAIRAQRAQLDTGIVLNVQQLYPVNSDAANIAATERHRDFHNGLFLEPLFNGQYPEGAMTALAHRMPDNWQDDLATIQQPLDYWGLNYYTPEYISDDPVDNVTYPATQLNARENVMRTDIGWEINASSMSDLLRDLYARYRLPPCYITENGAAYNHDVVDGVVDDQPRIDYIEAHLGAASHAISQNVPLRGYFAWSLMDNFEWAEGYAMRFGLIHVNYQTQQRTMKKSAHWYQDFLSEHRS